MQKTIEKHNSTWPKKPRRAPGAPGNRPQWSSGAKTGVGTAVSNKSRVWFTISRGTLNEIYYPDIDKANTRSIRFLVSDGKTFFSDEETDAHHKVRLLEDGIPGYLIESACRKGTYSLTKEIICDPVRDCLLVRVRFQSSTPQKLYLLIDPQIADEGSGNNIWLGDYKEIPMLFAQHRDIALAAVCSVPFGQVNCGFVGKSDGLTDLRKHCLLTKQYNVAKKGNVNLVAEIQLPEGGGEFVLSVAFGEQPAEAGQQARAGMLQQFDEVREKFILEWRNEQKRYTDYHPPAGQRDLYRTSTAVLQTHQSKRFPGGFVASLSIPWGFAKGDKDIGGYHVLWPRDLVETAFGKLACGDTEAACNALFYLACTQQKEGSWSQNMWLDGTVHMSAEQMDGIAMPILLADRLRREKLLGNFDPWPMVRAAASFLIKNGPGTQQDRWEAIAGFSVFTMACEVAALLAAADFAETKNDMPLADFFRATADAWNEAIDDFTFVRQTGLAKKHGVDGYYIRVAPLSAIENRSITKLRIKLSNHVAGNRTRKAVDVVSPDALALVRLGLRSANDPRITQTVHLLDATLRREMTTGPGWVRSTHDGYGEHADGTPFNGRGIGRCWPLLAGERGHYELACGHIQEAEQLLQTMAAQSSECGMIPEQVWDARDLPPHELFNGKPSGSSMPLAWAHAEYIKLMRSLQEGAVWDMPPQTVQRYQVEQWRAGFQIWTEREPRKWLTAGKQLRVDLCSPAQVSWAVDSDELSDPISTELVGGIIHSAMLQIPQMRSWKTLQLQILQNKKTRKFTLRSR